jgi:hypothetical protein
MADSQISISRIGTETLLVPLVGTAPLIVHKFSEKSKIQMLDAMQGRKTPKQPKDQEAEYLAAAYRHDDGTYGFPVIAFKAASVSACRFFGKSMPMTLARQCIFFNAELSKRDGQKLARIVGEPHMREDVVRVGMGGTDLRYRPEFTEWSTKIEVTFVKSMLTRESVLSLIEAGGMGVGVGEWRPEKKGDFGTYQIDPTCEVEVLTK